MAKAAKDLPATPSTPTSTARGPVRSGRLDGGLSLSEVLQVPALRGSTLIAGAAGADRRVERLNVMEVPDILPWVKPGELLLTTGYPLRHAPGALAGLITELDARGLAALGVKFGRYLDELPAAVLAEADRLGFPIVRLPDDVAFDDILEQVLTGLLNRRAAELSRSEDVHRALVQVVLDGGGLPELAAEVAALLGGAVAVTGEDGRVLADGGEIGTLAALYGSRCFDGGRLDDQRPGHRGPAVSGHEGLTGTHAVVPVVAGRTGHGRIVAYSRTGELREPDLHTLERAATVAALAITKQLAVRAVENKYRADFLRDLITGQVPPERAVSQCAGLGWDIDRPVVVLTAELDSGPDPEPEAGKLDRFGADWQAAVRLRDPLAPVAGFHREVVAVLGLPPRNGIERLVRDLVRDVPRNGRCDAGFSTGVSRPVTGPAGIPAGYEQARTAVRVGRRVHGDGAVAHFDALGVHRLLSLVPDGAELRSFAAETLGELAADDGDLRRTLEVLLEQNCNVAEAARTLHFHYNTLRYRIAKLERMVGPFTTDPHLRLNLQVALQVLRMRGG